MEDQNNNSSNNNYEDMSFDSNADEYFIDDNDNGNGADDGDEELLEDINDSDSETVPQPHIEDLQKSLPCLPACDSQSRSRQASAPFNKSQVDDIGSQAMDLISEVENRLDQLKEFSLASAQTLNSLKVQQLEIAKTREHLEYSQEEVGRLKEEIQRRDYERTLQEEQCKTADNQITMLMEQVKEYEAQIDTSRKLLHRHSDELVSRDYERMLHDMQCELARDKITELTRQAEQSQHYQSERNIVCAELEQLKEQEEAYNYERMLHDKQCETAARAIKELRSDLEQSNRKITDITENNNALHSEKMSALQQRLTGLDQQLEDRERVIGELKEQARSACEDLDDTKIVVDKSEIEDRDKAIEIMTGHIKSLQRELKKPQAKTEQRQQECNSNIVKPECTQNSDKLSGELRRKRLTRQIKLLKDRNRKLNWLQKQDGVSQEHLVNLRSEKQMLNEVKNTLIDAERKMIRKWAYGRTLTLMFWLVVIIVILASGSYFGAAKFWPGVYTATSSVKAVNRPGYDMTAEQIEQWQSTHEQMAFADSIVNTVSDRLRQRGYDNLSEPAAFREFLKSNLSVASEEPGSINFYLSAPGAADAQRILETYTIAFVSLSRAEAHKRTDGGMTKLVVPAYADPVPVEEQKLWQYAGITFGSSLLVFMALGGLVYRRLRKAEGVLDTIGNDDLFEPMSNWGGGAGQESFD